MEKINHSSGKINPKAPVALSGFAFLIGKWRFNAKYQSSSGEWEKFQGTWEGRFILDGYAIADEYRMTNSSGEVLVLGMNFRVYDSAKQRWNIKWLNALDGTWVDLTSPEFGGAHFDDNSVTYVFKDPAAAWAYTRATYTSVSREHFRWLGEKSEDRNTWSEFMVIDCHRTGEV
jgi:hypothetical protein